MSAIRNVPFSRGTALGMAAEIVIGFDLLLVVAGTDLGPSGKLLEAAAVVALTSAGLLALRSGGPTGDLLELILGTFGLAAGGGIGLSHLVLEGFSASVVPGLAAFAAGLFATVAGGLALTRRLRRWWRLLALPAALVIAQFWLLPVAAAFVATAPARPAFTATVPAGARAVRIETAEGIRLAAWYTPSRNGAAVVLLPGAGSTKASTIAHAQVLARHGIGVLALETRGVGESTGQAMLWGWGGERDIAAAIDYLSRRSEVDPGRIGLVGLSMGGEQAITAAALDGRVRAVVAEGAEARVAGDLGPVAPDLDALISRADTILAWAAADLLTEASPPMPLAEAVRRLDGRPLLLISAADPDETAANVALQAQSRSTVELWQPAGVGHTQALSREPAEWERRVVAFLEGGLGG